jgi:ATP-dependent RNA helicase SUPV3L1/SUV3
MDRASDRPDDRGRRVTAILGPTNTGKTHLAIERMLQHPSGIMGLPLRLLAREVYNRVVEKAGVGAVALITGEEKIKPRDARYWISTIEAMPRDLDVDFVAIDEIQVAADLDRGHVFTDRLLNRRGRVETLVIGASTMHQIIERLLPGAPIITRPRLSTLMFAGERKISRLPPRSAIVAFSAEEVYAIAEFIRRQRGGAAVVLGALSPRTRNAQVALYQSGDVDYIVATDAIGMGLNLDVDHVAFAGDRKFDGWHYRRLTPAEFGQIAGRAGRHVKDGTFGTTGRCSPFDEDLVDALENHRFDPLVMLQWRNTDLDFSSIDALQASLDRQPKREGLTRAPLAEDVLVLDLMAHDEDVRRQTKTNADIARLWDACQVPDYRKLSPAAHAELVMTIFRFTVRAGKIPDDWFARHLATLDRTDGEIDILSARIAQTRTFNYIANRPDWLIDPEHWQGVTRQVEDSLSDALHERLAHRFIDRRTSVLMRRLRENAMLEAEITSGGDVVVEGQHVGALQGFRFTLDPQAAGEAARTLNAAAQKALASEIEGRATRVSEAVDDAFVLARDGAIRWLGEIVGKIAAGDHALRPRVHVLADEQLTGAALELVQKRLDLWLAQHVKKLLGALVDLETAEGVEGIGRGIAFQVAEALGVLERARVANDVKSLEQNARSALRKLGVRFGAYHLYLPLLLKPAPRALAAQLWALKHGGIEGVKGLDEAAHLAATGRTSFVADKETPRALYLAAGFRVCGERAVRVDILERLADLIRPAIAYRPGVSVGTPPQGSADGEGFVVTVGMTSLAGCSGEAFASILKSLGYQSEQRKGPAITVPLLAPAPTEPIKQPEALEASDAAAMGETPAEASPEGADESLETSPEASAEPAPVEDSNVETEAAAAEEAPAPIVAEEAPSHAVSESELVEQVAVVESPVETPVSGTVEPEVVADADASSVEAAPAADAANDLETTVETPVVEEPLIDIWRPGRRPHNQQHQGRRDQPGRDRPRGPRRPHGGAPRPEGQVAAPVEGAPEGAQAPSGDQQRRPPREGAGQGDRAKRFENFKRPEGPREGGRPPGGGDRPRGPRPPNQKFGGGRPDRPNRDQPRGGAFASTERPSPRERAPDPNSPFAKLLALKADLENKARNKD